ncbi:F510_1955 family glycosylhydrolase [Bacillus pinisoli]|uniref:F510_1955 family glycosylhydrolase n=1 Tax=Bacillus pinisoli TaxID=2901866 RepID=UPI001FF58F25|nr:hypothetical protein [Bacillus pinisoli]
MKKRYILIAIISFVLSACGNQAPEQEKSVEKDSTNSNHQSTHSAIAADEFFAPFSGNLEHIHGLGYAGNQQAIFFASHDGLKVYEDGSWYSATEFNNDYMGFNAVDKGFYTSGHPGKGVDLENPLGLSRSYDNGKTLEFLGFQGESDFHAMGVGFENHTVYVLNEQKNSKMDVGLYVTEDDGENWDKLAATNLGEKIFSIAVHPANSKIVAVASEEGIFLSEDRGESFTLLTSNLQGTSVFFSTDALWYGAYGKEPILMKYLLSNSSQEKVNLPQMEQDAVMYLAQNPQNEKEVVFYSFNGDVFITQDGTSTWEKIVSAGTIK